MPSYIPPVYLNHNGIRYLCPGGSGEARPAGPATPFCFCGADTNHEMAARCAGPRGKSKDCPFGGWFHSFHRTYNHPEHGSVRHCGIRARDNLQFCSVCLPQYEAFWARRNQARFRESSSMSDTESSTEDEDNSSDDSDADSEDDNGADDDYGDAGIHPVPTPPPSGLEKKDPSPNPPSQGSAFNKDSGYASDAATCGSNSSKKRKTNGAGESPGSAEGGNKRRKGPPEGQVMPGSRMTRSWKAYVKSKLRGMAVPNAV